MLVLGEVGEETTPPPCPNPAIHRCWPSRAFGWALGVALLYVLYLQSCLTMARNEAKMNTELWSIEEVARWTWTEERLQQVEGKVMLMGELLVPARKAWLTERLKELALPSSQVPRVPAQTSAPALPATP